MVKIIEINKISGYIFLKSLKTFIKAKQNVLCNIKINKKLYKLLSYSFK